MSKDPFCSKAHASDPAHLETVVVGQGGGLENVVLYISGGLTGSALTQVPTSVPVFDQRGCGIRHTCWPWTSTRISRWRTAIGHLTTFTRIQTR